MIFEQVQKSLNWPKGLLRRLPPHLRAPPRTPEGTSSFCIVGQYNYFNQMVIVQILIYHNIIIKYYNISFLIMITVHHYQL